MTLNYRKAQNKEVLQDNTRLAEEKVKRALNTEGIWYNSTVIKLVIVGVYLVLLVNIGYISPLHEYCRL